MIEFAFWCTPSSSSLSRTHKLWTLTPSRMVVEFIQFNLIFRRKANSINTYRNLLKILGFGFSGVICSNGFILWRVDTITNFAKMSDAGSFQTLLTVKSILFTGWFRANFTSFISGRSLKRIKFKLFILRNEIVDQRATHWQHELPSGHYWHPFLFRDWFIDSIWIYDDDIQIIIKERKRPASCFSLNWIFVSYLIDDIDSTLWFIIFKDDVGLEFLVFSMNDCIWMMWW